MSKNLLQEAIAEATQIRNAAVANAVKELEENLTPAIKEALAAQLEEEFDAENEEESLEESANAGFTEVKPKKVVKEAEDEDAEVAEKDDEADADAENAEADAAEAEENAEEAKEEAEETEEDAEAAESEAEEIKDDDKIEDLTVGQLKDIIADMVALANPVPAPEGEMGADMEAADVEGTGEEEAPAADAEEIPADANNVDNVEDDAAAEDEEIDLNELLKELEDEEKVPEKKACPACNEELEKVKKELAEANETVKKLKSTLSEVNLLNAKLLYTSKMFNKRSLTESQKAQCLRALDKAKSIAEVKDTFKTLCESIKMNESKTVLKEHRSFASSAAGTSTKTNVVDVDPVVRRMQMLAGIINN